MALFSGTKQEPGGLFGKEYGRQGKIAAYQKESELFQKESDKYASIASTLEGFNVVPNFFNLVYKGYSEYPQKFIEDVKAGAKDIQDGKPLTGITKSGLRTAGDTAIMLFTPISAAIGTVLQATGGQKLIDKTGEVIADATGIADIEAFQKFAMEHPNAGEDFERLLMLATAGLETGKVEPKRMVQEAKTMIEHVRKPKIRQLPVETTSQTNRIGVRNIEAESQPYTPESQLPVIEYGSKSKSPLETIPFSDVPIDFASQKVRKGGLTYEPIGIFKPNSATKQTVTKSPTKPIPSRQAATQPTTPFLDKSATGVKVAKKAQELGIDLDIADLPSIQKVSAVNEATKAKNLIETQPEIAKNILRGKQELPADINFQALYKQMENKAFREMDVSLIDELSRMQPATKEARALRLMRDDYMSVNPIRVIRDIRETANKTIKRKYGATREKLLKNADKEISKVNKNTSWESFIKSIQC